MNENKQEEVKKTLRELFRKGNYTAYTILRHVSSSGMFRVIDVYTIIDNQPIFLSGYIAELGQYKRDKKRDGLRTSGCGMDMGFDMVYTTSRQLWNTKEEAQSENIVIGRNGDTQPETDGGYLIKQRWL